MLRKLVLCGLTQEFTGEMPVSQDKANKSKN